MNQKVKKIAFAVAVAALFSSFNGYAQKSDGDSKALRLGIGFSAGLPTNDFYSVALGGDLKLQQDFTTNISGTLSAGYTSFSLDGNNTGSVNFIPLKVGIKVFPVQRFYLGGEVGVGFGVGDLNDGTSFVYAPGIGVGTNAGWDFGLRYEGFARDGGNIGQVALRVAYGFNLGK